jgi:hypothetical protein
VAGARAWFPGPQTEATARTTDAEGLVQLPAPVGLLVTCAVTDGASPPGVDAPVLVLTGPIQAGQRFRQTVELTPWFHGRLLAAESGAPIAGIPVGPQDPLGGGTVSGLDGSFRMRSGPILGKHVARIEAPGRSPARLVPVAGFDGPERPYEIRLTLAAELEPTIVDAAGEPVPGAAVTVTVDALALMHPAGRPAGGKWKDTARTGGDGRCRLAGLPAEVAIAVEARHGDDLLETSLVLQPGERASPVWRLGAQTFVRGVLLDEDDRVVADQEVWACAPTSDHAQAYLSPHAQPAARGRTDGDGRFELSVRPGSWWIGPAPGVKEPRALEVSAFIANGSQELSPAVCCPLATRVALTGDGLELELRTWRRPTITGQVLTADGRNAHDTLVVGELAVAGGWAFAQVRQGRF